MPLTSDGVLRTFARGRIRSIARGAHVAKLFSLVLAMEAERTEIVFHKIGVGRAGCAFNSPIAVVDMPTHTGDPLIRAGTTATVSMISGRTPDEKWNRILCFDSRTAGRHLPLIESVCKSEAAIITGNRTRARDIIEYVACRLDYSPYSRASVGPE